MARIRTIKPEFWTSEQVVECSPITRLLFIGLWNFCDDAGRHQASTKRLKMEVFPGDSITHEEIESSIRELIANKLLIQYESQGESYWQVTGWNHQKIEKPTVRFLGPEESKIPQPIADHSSNTRRPVADSSPPEGNGTDTEGNGEESKTPYPFPSSVAGANALAASTGKVRNPNSVFRKIEQVFPLGTGINFRALDAWFRWQQEPGDNLKPVFSPDEWLPCVTIAEHAASGVTPHALFAKLAGSKDRASVLGRIPEKTRQRAAQRLQEDTRVRSAPAAEKPIDIEQGRMRERLKLFDCFTCVSDLENTQLIHDFLHEQGRHPQPFVKWREMFPEGKIPTHPSPKNFVTQFINTIGCAEAALKTDDPLGEFKNQFMLIAMKGGPPEEHQTAHRRYMKFTSGESLQTRQVDAAEPVIQ